MEKCLLDFPTELLQHIFQFLPASDIVSVALTCRRFHDITKIEALWQYVCQRDYNLLWSDKNEMDVTSHQLYTRLLHRYGGFQGLWKLGTTGCLFGMLVHIKLEPPYVIAYHCRAPGFDVREPMDTGTELFRVLMSEKGGKVRCRRHDQAELKVVLRDKLCYCCKECLNLHPKDMNPFQQEELQFIMPRMEGIEVGEMERILSMAHSTAFWSAYLLERVSLPLSSPVSPVLLGLYKGTYGPHGVELINLVMASDGNRLLGEKLTGDPNVPAGKTSLFVYLHCPMTLTLEQQQSVEALRAVKPEIQPSVARVPPDAQQPFFLSPDLDLDAPTRDGSPIELPRTCRARYHADGRIAGHGFHNPSLCKAQLVVFTEVVFGVVWLDLDSFSLFYRVQEELT